jgi:hypothetical protein
MSSIRVTIIALTLVLGGCTQVFSTDRLTREFGRDGSVSEVVMSGPRGDAEDLHGEDDRRQCASVMGD